MAELPHIVIININEVVGLKRDLDGLGENLGVYVTMVGMDSNGLCFSRKQSSVGYVHKHTIRWPEKEQYLICMKGNNGHVVLNVLTSTLFSSEKLLGQVVLDMKDRQHNVDGLSPYFDVSEVAKRFTYGDKFIVHPPVVGEAHFPLYDKTGCAYESMNHSKFTDNGSLRLVLSLPSVFSSLCGTFYEKYNSLFGTIEIKKLWVVVHNNCVHVYNNRFENGDETINFFEVLDISHIDDYSSRKNGNVDAGYTNLAEGGICFKVKRTDSLGINYEEEFVWLWSDDTSNLKGLWKRIFTRHRH